MTGEEGRGTEQLLCDRSEWADEDGSTHKKKLRRKERG